MSLISTIEIFSDGGSRGNPGPGASAFVVLKNGINVHEQSYFLKQTTNNVAEYFALLMAIDWLIKNIDRNGVLEYKFFLDSELIVKQLTGVYKIKNKTLKEIAVRIKKLLPLLEAKYSFTHIVREKNKTADKLVNQKLDENM